MGISNLLRCHQSGICGCEIRCVKIIQGLAPSVGKLVQSAILVGTFDLVLSTGTPDPLSSDIQTLPFRSFCLLTGGSNFQRPSQATPSSIPSLVLKTTRPHSPDSSNSLQGRKRGRRGNDCKATAFHPVECKLCFLLLLLGYQFKMKTLHFWSHSRYQL